MILRETREIAVSTKKIYLRRISLTLFIVLGYLIGNSDSSLLIEFPNYSELSSYHPDAQAKQNEENMFLPLVTKYVQIIVNDRFLSPLLSSPQCES